MFEIDRTPEDERGWKVRKAEWIPRPTIDGRAGSTRAAPARPTVTGKVFSEDEVIPVT